MKKTGAYLLPDQSEILRALVGVQSSLMEASAEYVVVKTKAEQEKILQQIETLSAMRQDCGKILSNHEYVSTIRKKVRYTTLDQIDSHTLRLAA